uniref:Amidohydrolase-related domain-containing protein n=1 Tax=candidate division CPR3 bacterium TaxID=2268181 RepID=A0A7C4R420_UNCC3
MKKLVINAHTHLEFSDRGYLYPSKTMEFTNLLRKVVKTNPPSDSNSYKKSCELGVKKLLECGTDIVCDVSKTGYSVEPLVKAGLSGIVYIQFLGENIEAAKEKFKKVKNKIKKAKKIAKGSNIEIGFCLHAPYSINQLMWKPVLKYCKKNGLPICIHVAESPAERELFTKGTGKLRKIERDFELTPINCPKLSPIKYLEKMGVLKLRPLLVHAVQVDDEDIEIIKSSGSSVVHCPRSNTALQCGRMPLEKFIKAGIDIYFGTDSLMSSPSLDINDEVKFALNIHKRKVSKEKIKKIAEQEIFTY